MGDYTESPLPVLLYYVAMVSLMHVSFTHLTLSDALAAVTERVVQKQYNRPLTVFTPNTEQLLQARQNSLFLKTLEVADIRIPDAIGLVKADWWRAFVTGQSWQLRERVTGVDLAEGILAMAAEWGLKVCLVGGMGNVSQQACVNLRKRFSGLDVVSVEVGKIEITNDPSTTLGASKFTNTQMAEKINALKPDIVFVGLGAPKQEMWVEQNTLTLMTQVVMVVGGAIDMWAGKVHRAPLWLRSMGFEWLWRLMQEPWRITRQRRLVQFVWLVLWGKWE